MRTLLLESTTATQACKHVQCFAAGKHSCESMNVKRSSCIVVLRPDNGVAVGFPLHLKLRTLPFADTLAKIVAALAMHAMTNIKPIKTS